jgi:hypothetical protein
MRRPIGNQATVAALLRIAQGGPEHAELTKLVAARPSSPEEIRTVAINFGSQPAWEAYRKDLLDLPRGLMRSALDPEGLLTQRTFGIWEPIINAS